MYRFDTHVHTCLSPCAELEMHPAGAVRAASEAGLDGIAVVDHNAAGNVAATARAGRKADVAVLPGMEVTSAEEAHILAYLPDATAALELQERVFRALPGRNDPEALGLQVIASEDEEVLGFEEHLLAGATAWSVEEVVDRIHRSGGLAVAAHVDREGFGIIGQLGMIPPGLPLDGLEISPNATLPGARGKYAPRDEYRFLCGSDAHEPKLVGQAVSFLLLDEPSCAELRMALRGEGGRAVLGGGRPMLDLAMHILDVAQNAADAGATLVEVDLREDLVQDILSIEVRDNGRGMDETARAAATDPFYTTRTTRRVGLGLPLLQEAARAAGGKLEIESEAGRGTRVVATFRHGHVDRQPIGDIESTVLVLLAGNPGLDVVFRHARGGRDYTLDTRDVRAALGGAPLAGPEGLPLLRGAIRAGEEGLEAGSSQKTGGTHD